MGRWISRDLIGEDGGLNLYGYVLNNPIRFGDSYGLALSSLDTLEGVEVMMFITEQEAQSAAATAAVAVGTYGAMNDIEGSSDGGSCSYSVGKSASSASEIAAGVIAVQANRGDKVKRSIDEALDPNDFADSGNFNNHEKMPNGDNQHFNKQFRDALKQLNIKDGTDEARRLHRYISKRGLKTIDEIIEAGKELGYGI